ncbi:FadR/GntR family transcriptional regulator [Lentzea flaviverrucosa]|uniref:DNA-binding transcriptional regulator, FadR family n=1 Tax=Lentzea flaviverrucosa TaxID=200379 RepID=A0A1H9VND9_9PSEU|nr:FCD domain-containing protein [Lentzea flaviverrucosa]RDI23731.1 GntR family transcriptional regulator [Lentzea flaviverrucosa]SES23225.1 DNA-binding transcriptional regulator, FadR family [Lentzea flaviverrucosa]
MPADDVHLGESWSLSPDSRRPLPELIEQKLRELIIGKTFKEGDRLPTEPVLADKLDVARSSLRTALQRLQLQGIVEVRRGLGWYVRRSDLAAVDEHLEGKLAARQFSPTDLLETRISLETTAAALAAIRAGDGELDELAKLSRRYQRATVEDTQEVLDSDEEFHLALVRASHNELLVQMYQALVPGLRDCKRHAQPSREVHNRSANDHEQVVWFLRRRDPDGVKSTLATHLLGLYNDLATDVSHDRATLNTFVGHDEPMWQQTERRR